MPAGRPTLYRVEYCTDAAKLCFMFGATDVQLAAWFNVDEMTINLWKRTHPEFMMAIKPSKDIYDRRIEHSLAERAMGYSCVDTKFASFEGQITDREEYIKHYPPETTAAIFWLTNRQREKWKRSNDALAPVDVADALNNLAHRLPD